MKTGHYENTTTTYGFCFKTDNALEIWFQSKDKQQRDEFANYIVAKFKSLEEDKKIRYWEEKIDASLSAVSGDI